MKITKKGILITIPVFLAGSFLIVAPQYGFMLVKHSMISYENEKEAKKRITGFIMKMDAVSYIMMVLLFRTTVRYWMELCTILMKRDM